jgi:LysR family transcriptional regulator (chromosome initiation inhibitor)
MNPEPLVAPHLASGALVEIIPDTPLDIALYWQFTRLAAPALGMLTDAIGRAARETLVAP